MELIGYLVVGLVAVIAALWIVPAVVVGMAVVAVDVVLHLAMVPVYVARALSRAWKWIAR